MITLAPVKKIISDNAGQATVEWALVLAAVALPMYFIIVVTC